MITKITRRNVFNIPTRATILIDNYRFEWVMASFPNDREELKTYKDGERVGTAWWLVDDDHPAENPLEFAQNAAQWVYDGTFLDNVKELGNG